MEPEQSRCIRVLLIELIDEAHEHRLKGRYGDAL